MVRNRAVKIGNTCSPWHQAVPISFQIHNVGGSGVEIHGGRFDWRTVDH